MRFDSFFRFLMEQYSSSEDAFRQKQAEEYFSIGHQNGYQEDEDSEQDYCWIWVDGRLRYGRGTTHNSYFGPEVVKRARFKGWYETSRKILSFVDDREMVKEEDDIPQQLFDHLQRQFSPKIIRIF